VLQCVVVCCSVLQCVVVCCSVLQCIAVRCSVVKGALLSRRLVCLHCETRPLSSEKGCVYRVES